MRQHRQGLTVPQFQVLMRIQVQGGISLSCMAEHLGCSLPTASRLVTNLVNRGYLARTESGRDRRQIVLELTAQGRVITQAARQASLTQMSAEFASLHGPECALVCQAMAVLSAFVAGVKQPSAAPRLPSGALRSTRVRKRRQHVAA